jgi:hypothetical protein
VKWKSKGKGDWAGQWAMRAGKERRGMGLVGCTRKNREGKRWAGYKRIGPTGRVLKIAFPIFKLIFLFSKLF